MDGDGDLTSVVLQAQEGDAAAFACLVERNGPALRRFCARLAGPYGSPDDLVQETLLRAFRALGSLSEPARFEAWLLAIAANLARKWWRAQARWPLSLEALALSSPDLALEPLQSPQWSPDRIVEEHEQSEILRRALDALPPAMGRAIALHYLGGLDYREIAAALDVPVSTVKGRLFKSRRRLREDLTAAGVEAPGRTRTQKGIAMETNTEEAIVDSIRANLLAPRRMVVLKSKDRERYLHIGVGVPEADAIAVKLQGKELPRPMAHDLMLAGFEGLGGQLTGVTIHDLQAKTFFAQLHLRRGRADVTLDARPSDAIALAVRAGVPIRVSTALLDEHGTDAVVRERAAGGFLETERAKKVFALSLREVARYGRSTLGSDVLLVALLAEGQSVAARVLAEAGVTLPAARAAVAALFGIGDEEGPEGRMPDPANPQLPELARAAARELGRHYVGTEHLLMAMLDEEDGPARRILHHLGVDVPSLRARLIDRVREAEAQEHEARPHN